MIIKMFSQLPVNSSPASFTFTSSLDPDQARQNVGPDLDPNCLIVRWYPERTF